MALWHLGTDVYFSHWRPPIYILYTLENLAGHPLPLLAGIVTATATVVVFVLHNVRIGLRPEFVDGVAVMPPLGPVPGCSGTARSWRDAPRASVRGIHCLLYPAGSD